MTAAYLRLAEARQKLIECADFVRLREARHRLTDGVVLTSVSDVPTEMSFKCTRCAEVFWFENLSWREGGFADWRLCGPNHTCDEGRNSVADNKPDQGPRVYP